MNTNGRKIFRMIFAPILLNSIFMMRTKTPNFFFFFLSLWLVSLMIILVLFVSFSMKNIEKSKHPERGRKHFHSKYLKLKENGTSVSLKGYYSSKSKIFSLEHGSRVLSSDFGNKEYVCHGVCYCENIDYNDNIEDRRNLGLTSSRTLTYLVSAVTSVFALENAKDYFSRECEKALFLEDCDSSLVSSTVQSCDEIVSVEPAQNQGVERDNKGISVQRFDCGGYCDFTPFSKSVLGYYGIVERYEEYVDMDDFENEMSTREKTLLDNEMETKYEEIATKIANNPEFKEMWNLIHETEWKLLGYGTEEDTESSSWRTDTSRKCLQNIIYKTMMGLDCGKMELRAIIEVVDEGEPELERKAEIKFHAINLMKFCKSNSFIDFTDPKASMEIFETIKFSTLERYPGGQFAREYGLSSSSVLILTSEIMNYLSSNDQFGTINVCRASRIETPWYNEEYIGTEYHQQEKLKMEEKKRVFCTPLSKTTE